MKSKAKIVAGLLLAAVAFVAALLPTLAWLTQKTPQVFKSML